jgi:hypothetical protein
MDKQQTWSYVDLHDYSAPSAPVAEAAHKGLKKLWHRLRPGRVDASNGTPETSQESSLEFFRGLFSPPDWRAASPHLAARVDGRLAAGQRIQVIVGGPHRCTADMLRQLARARRWTVLEAPAWREVLEQRLEPLNTDGDPVVVIPQLANWFLRHDDGLHVIRSLLDWFQTARQRVVLGCHSWAWSYLDKAIQLGAALPNPVVLAPLDAPALQQWLRELAVVSGQERTVFREASSGKMVLELGGAMTGADGDISNLLTYLASQSRGLPEIAWSLWRESILRFDPKMLADTAVKAAAGKPERTIWVPSWGQLTLPELPSKPGHLILFLLHNLLLHAGVPADVLPLLMPFSSSETQRGLRELETRGVIELDEDRWRVTAAGYVSVRHALNDEGFLVDSL